MTMSNGDTTASFAGPPKATEQTFRTQASGHA